MATISGYDSAAIGVLFSSLNRGSQNTGLMGGGTSDLLGINYIDYATIRSGSYFKLLNAFYSKSDAGDEVKSSTVSRSTSTSKDDAKVLTAEKSAATSLKASAEKLTKTGSGSVFEKVTTKDKDGNETTDYDKDAIYKAVSAFVDDYNQLVDKASDSKTTTILRSARSMVNYTKANEKLLSKIGITMDKDNQLKLDKEAFQKADMDTVKSLFQTRGSYGQQIQTQASFIESYAKNESARSNTYARTGRYTYNHNTGDLYSSVM